MRGEAGFGRRSGCAAQLAGVRLQPFKRPRCACPLGVHSTSGKTRTATRKIDAPVVGFDVGGVPEMVRPGVTGDLAPPGDTQALAAVMSRLLSDSDRLQAMAESCRRTVLEEYSMDTYVTGYEALYESLAGV